MAPCVDQAPPRGRVPAAVALARVGAEIERLTARLARVEEAIGRVLGDAGAASAELVIDLQEIDLARQESAALAHVLAALAAALPEGARVDLARAASDVPLADLADRLAGGAPRAPRARARADAVLFE